MVIRVVVSIVLALLVGWAALALALDLPWPRLGTVAGVAFAAACAACAILVRPWRRAALGCAAAVAVVMAWWLLIPPSNDRDWQPDVRVLPWATFDGDRVTLHAIRDNEYRTETDYTVRHHHRTVSLADLRTVDLFLSYWGSPWIAHTIMSFGFGDGPPVAISIETRKERGEEYSALRGFFRQFELTYVVAEERDVVRLRTNYRGEDVYLYRLGVSRSVARGVFLDYLREINRLRDRPEWYNALAHNCTTAIRGHARPYLRSAIPSWKVFLNGHLDQLIYDNGLVDRSRPFGDLRAWSRINERARAADADPEFSRRIRQGLPRMEGAAPLRRQT